MTSAEGREGGFRAEQTVWCFPLGGRGSGSYPIAGITLSSRSAEALANLLPILGCGEEAATLAFDSLANTCRSDDEARAAFLRISGEERVHHRLLSALAAALPAPVDAESRLKAARRFHIDLGRGDAVDHLARIAALDSAVCTMLSRLTRTGTPIAADRPTATLLVRIHADEARHVRLARRIATSRRDRPLTDIAASARAGLADLLAIAGDDLETLAFDPRWITRLIAPLPDGLFA